MQEPPRRRYSGDPYIGSGYSHHHIPTRHIVFTFVRVAQDEGIASVGHGVLDVDVGVAVVVAFDNCIVEIICLAPMGAFGAARTAGRRVKSNEGCIS